jgi:tRNA threonylcarbamoyladenosine biosynthesis protein TsaE
MAKKENYESHSEAETMEIARKLGEKSAPGDIVGLYGNLGAGKTHFVKGFVQAFGISPEKVNSPTFNLIQEYQGVNGVSVYHFDCYRLESIAEALEIGAEEYFYGDGVSIIEWPEKISGILPDEIIRVTISVTGRNSRLIQIKYRNSN